MYIIRDEKRIKRLSQLSRGVSLFGIIALIGGLVLAFAVDAEGTSRYGDFLGGPDNLFRVQLAALGVGWICSQIGMYLAHRFVRSPRPDEVLDEALGRVARNGRLYHYVIRQVPHVLLSSSGIIILVAKYQTGNITLENDKWKQSGLGLRRFFGQENLGNPTREAENQINILADFIRKNAPEVEEVPVGAIIVFTHIGQKELDLQNTRIPAMHHSKVKSYLRRKRRNQPMPNEIYNALKSAFDAKAEHILEISDEFDG